MDLYENSAVMNITLSAGVVAGIFFSLLVFLIMVDLITSCALVHWIRRQERLESSFRNSLRQGQFPRSTTPISEGVSIVTGSPPSFDYGV